MTAIEKINAEMQKAPDDLYTEILGHYLIDRCTDPEDEALIGAEGKTLAGAMNAIESEARKRAKKRVGVLSDYETGKIVDDYFGLKPKRDLWQRSIRNAIGDDEPEEQPAGGVALDLADFL